MSYWSHHPEKLDEITMENLPEPWKTWVMDGSVALCDVPSEILDKAANYGEADYWGNKFDEAEMRLGPDR
jgi:hypothetical protein